MMQWGLGREVLREIWALVAGDSGQLSTQQFISCIYLMDNAKQVRVGLSPCLYQVLGLNPGSNPSILHVSGHRAAADRLPLH